MSKNLKRVSSHTCKKFFHRQKSPADKRDSYRVSVHLFLCNHFGGVREFFEEFYLFPEVFIIFYHTQLQKVFIFQTCRALTGFADKFIVHLCLVMVTPVFKTCSYITSI